MKRRRRAKVGRLLKCPTFNSGCFVRPVSDFTDLWIPCARDRGTVAWARVVSIERSTCKDPQEPAFLQDGARSIDRGVLCRLVLVCLSIHIVSSPGTSRGLVHCYRECPLITIIFAGQTIFSLLILGKDCESSPHTQPRIISPNA